MEPTYTYNDNSDMRNEGPPHEAFVPKSNPFITLYDPTGKVYCSVNCQCMQVGLVTCQNHIGELIDAA